MYIFLCKFMMAMLVMMMMTALGFNGNHWTRYVLKKEKVFESRFRSVVAVLIA